MRRPSAGVCGRWPALRTTTTWSRSVARGFFQVSIAPLAERCTETSYGRPGGSWSPIDGCGTVGGGGGGLVDGVAVAVAVGSGVDQFGTSSRAKTAKLSGWPLATPVSMQL